MKIISNLKNLIKNQFSIPVDTYDENGFIEVDLEKTLINIPKDYTSIKHCRVSKYSLYVLYFNGEESLNTLVSYQYYLKDGKKYKLYEEVLRDGYQFIKKEYQFGKTIITNYKIKDVKSLEDYLNDNKLYDGVLCLMSYYKDKYFEETKKTFKLDKFSKFILTLLLVLGLTNFYSFIKLNSSIVFLLISLGGMYIYWRSLKSL